MGDIKTLPQFFGYTGRLMTSQYQIFLARSIIWWFAPPKWSICLRPPAKDQGITWVVLVSVVLCNLVHFHLKINLSEKNFSLPGIWTKVLLLPSQALYQMSIDTLIHWYRMMENYLFNLRISKTTQQTLDQYWSTLVYLFSELYNLFLSTLVLSRARNILLFVMKCLSIILKKVQ